MYFHLPFPCHILLPMPSFSTTSKFNALLNTLSLSLLKPYLDHHSSLTLASLIQSTFQTQHTCKFLAPFFSNQRNSTHCSYYCSYSSSQNCHLILLQTTSLAPTQHCQSYTTLIYPFFDLEQKLSSTRKLTEFSKFYPSNSCSCCLALILVLAVLP